MMNTTERVAYEKLFGRDPKYLSADPENVRTLADLVHEMPYHGPSGQKCEADGVEDDPRDFDVLEWEQAGYDVPDWSFIAAVYNNLAETPALVVSDITGTSIYYPEDIPYLEALRKSYGPIVDQVLYPSGRTIGD